MRITAKTVANGFALFLAYLLASEFGVLVLAHVHSAPALIWPASGIGLAGVWLGGIELWPAIFLGSLLLHFINGTNPWYALALAIANVFQIVAAYYLLKLLRFDSLLSRLRDSLALIVTALVAGTIVPTLGIIFLSLQGALPHNVNSVWGPWWTGEILSLLIVAPLVMRWLPQMRLKRDWREWTEWVLALGALVAVAFLLFWTHHTALHGISLVYLILVPLMWIALRLGPRAMTFALFLMTVLVLSGTAFSGLTPMAMIGARLLQDEIFIIIISVLFLILVSVAEERKDATTALARHVGELERTLANVREEDEAKNSFIAMLAHELRNPLAPLLSSLELMRLKEEEGTERRDSVNAMRGRVRTMARLLDDLLDISRVSRGKLELAREKVDVRMIVERAIETAEPEMLLRSHTFTASLPKVSIELFADPIRLEQIFVNILINAAKYTESHGEISLALTREKNEAVVRIIDNGAGILPEMLTKIFEPFRQGEPGVRAKSGLGIGLALSQNLAKMHGGSIVAQSRGSGRGSEFIVRLPILPEAGGTSPVHKVAKALKNLASPTRALKILVVDDNAPAAESMAELLRHIGHNVHIAYDGTRALTEAEAWEPDAAILDIGLPDMEGHELAKRLREQGSEAVLIALTGYGQAEDKRKAREAGFGYHLTKPAGLADIEAILRGIRKQ